MTANRSKTPNKLLVLNDEESPNSPVSTNRGKRRNTTDKTKHSISPLNSAQLSPTPSGIPVLGEGGGLLDGFSDEAQTSPGSRPGSRSGSRPGSSASKSVPPSPHSGSSLRRQPTPTKQILLQAVKRKEEKEGPIPLEPDLTWGTFIRTPRSFPNTSRKSPEAYNVSKPESLPNEEEKIIGAHAMDREFSSLIAASANGLSESSGLIESERPELKRGESLSKSENPEHDEESSSSTEEGDVTEDEDDIIGHKGKAPNNLLMEFLTAIMEKDYQTAAKLCKMILIYEPDNKEALSFAPLIEEKMKLDEEADVDESEGVDDEEDEDDDEEDDEKGEEDGEDSVEDSDEDEDGDDEEEDEEEEGSDHGSQSDNDSDGPLDSGFSDGT
ncbi:hypothetical protein ACJMK2_021470 [Sinanodonta woodiana]|uniref:Glutamate-rich protein 2 n=1 Tax=Sinanodonta woodiana TaxID=1069815 RepID=A0ABD3TI61_SINWO